MLLRTLIFLLASAAAQAQAPFCALIKTLVAGTSVAQAHWGISVTMLDGTPLCGINQGQLFRPASNAKLFTATAALALLGPTRTFTTAVVASADNLTELSPGRFSPKLDGDLWLTGGGDANLSTRPIPYAPGSVHAPDAPDPLEQLADAVAATGLQHITGSVVGDDGLWLHESPASNWSVGDLLWDYGAPISALSVYDNRLKVTLTPGPSLNGPATVTLSPSVPFYEIHPSITTTAAKTAPVVTFIREPGSRVLRIFGSIPSGGPYTEEIALSEPAEYAALVFKSLLEARGLKIDGNATSFHRLYGNTASFEHQSMLPLPTLKASPEPPPFCEFASCRTLATHSSPALLDDITVTLKVSQNLHAELLLHHLAQSVAGEGSTAQGIRVVRQFLLNAGIAPGDFFLDDGSGLSTHDLTSPRALTQLLAFAARQPWFESFKAALPIGGVDGSLASRFPGPLKGRVFAKTGTLGESRALSGYLTAASGSTVVFSILIDNHPPTGSADRTTMDKIVEAIAAAN